MAEPAPLEWLTLPELFEEMARRCDCVIVIGAEKGRNTAFSRYEGKMSEILGMLQIVQHDLLCHHRHTDKEEDDE